MHRELESGCQGENGMLMSAEDRPVHTVKKWGHLEAEDCQEDQKIDE